MNDEWWAVVKLPFGRGIQLRYGEMLFEPFPVPYARTLAAALVAAADASEANQ